MLQLQEALAQTSKGTHTWGWATQRVKGKRCRCEQYQFACECAWRDPVMLAWHGACVVCELLPSCCPDSRRSPEASRFAVQAEPEAHEREEHAIVMHRRKARAHRRRGAHPPRPPPSARLAAADLGPGSPSKDKVLGPTDSVVAAAAAGAAVALAEQQLHAAQPAPAQAHMHSAALASPISGATSLQVFHKRVRQKLNEFTSREQALRSMLVDQVSPTVPYTRLELDWEGAVEVIGKGSTCSVLKCSINGVPSAVKVRSEQ